MQSKHIRTVLIVAVAVALVGAFGLGAADVNASGIDDSASPGSPDTVTEYSDAEMADWMNNQSGDAHWNWTSNQTSDEHWNWMHNRTGENHWEWMNQHMGEDHWEWMDQHMGGYHWDVSSEFTDKNHQEWSNTHMGGSFQDTNDRNGRRGGHC